MRRIVVLNGHFENTWPSVEGVDLGLREVRRDGIADMQVLRLEYWDFVRRATLDRLFPDGFPGTELEHASLLETSLMLLLRPDLVDMAKVPSDGPAKFPTYDMRPLPRRFRPAALRRAGGRAGRLGREGRLADERPCRADRGGDPQGVFAVNEASVARMAHPQPIDAALVPRFAGLSTFMRLPAVTSPAEVDIALIGVPFDGGTTNRAGARHGPREIRNQSSLMRRVHHVTGVAPYDLVRVGDLGDAPINPIDLKDALAKIEGFFADVRAAGATPITAGGDHLISLPILRALGRGRPLGMIHFDAHSDTNDRYFGDNPYTHGTPFRRAVEEGLLDPKRIVQIGIRGSIYDPADYDFAKANGIRIIFIEEFSRRGAGRRHRRGARHRRRQARPTSPSTSMSIDPSMAPGTGTPEIGGITTREAQEMLRLLAGLDIVGADVVEVAPPFDLGGITALAGATVMFELLCVIAANRARQAAE